MSAIISAVIRQLRDEFIANGEAPSYYDINCGGCEDFAVEVVKRLGGSSDELFEIGAEELMHEGGDGFDWKLLSNYWNIKGHPDLSKKSLDDLGLGGHVWITHQKRHYDAECPDGVDNFLDLPLFKRAIISELRGRGKAVADIATEDVIPPPACPILPDGTVLESVLADERAIADFVATYSTNEIDEDLIAEFYFDSHARLRILQIDQLVPGPGDNNIPCPDKQARYAAMPSATRPPILIGFSNEIMEGHHRYRDALAKGETHIIGYVPEEGRLEPAAKPRPAMRLS